MFFVVADTPDPTSHTRHLRAILLGKDVHEPPLFVWLQPERLESRKHSVDRGDKKIPTEVDKAMQWDMLSPNLAVG